MTDQPTALYVPSKAVRTERVMTTALLMFEKLMILTPREGFEPLYTGNWAHLEKGWYVVGGKGEEGQIIMDDRSKEIKSRAHLAIEDLLTAPDENSDELILTMQKAEFGDSLDEEMLLDQTWDLLLDKGLVGVSKPDAGGFPDYPCSAALKTRVMTIVADCASENNMAKITDDSEFWHESKHLIKPSVSAPDLVDIAIDVVDTNQIGLDRLIEFRTKNTTHNAALRSKFRMHIVQQVQAINQLEPGDFLRWKEEFRRECQDDYAALQEELKMSAISIITKRFFSASLPLSGADLLAKFTHHLNGKVVGGVMGGIAMAYELRKQRLKTLEEHPMSLLHVLK